MNHEMEENYSLLLTNSYSDNDSNHDVLDRLKNTYNCLFALLNSLIKEPNSAGSESWKLQLQEEVNNVRAIVDAGLHAGNEILLCKIYHLSNVLSLVCANRKCLDWRLHKFKEDHGLQHAPSNLPGLDEIVRDSNPSTHSISGESCQKSKSHKRLTKRNVEILNNWFQENEEQPYLSSLDLKNLVEATNLSVTQVKNWVSNKRRKEKSSFVSEDILRVLMN